MSDWTRRLSRTAQSRSKSVVSSGRSVVSSGRSIQELALELLDPGAAAADRQRAIDVFALLAPTPSGRDDLQLLVEARVTLSFNTNKSGAGYSVGRNHITLNRTQVAARTALDFIHEVTHARAHTGGYGADINGSKEAYVSGILREETQTFFREAIVGRELVHLADATTVKHVLTVHPVQMWFQLVHGVAYHKPPSPQVLAADAALDSATLGELVDALTPYFARYVQYYRLVEAAKWDMAHGLRRREKPEVISGVIADCAAEQRLDWTFPKRPT